MRRILKRLPEKGGTIAWFVFEIEGSEQIIYLERARPAKAPRATADDCIGLIPDLPNLCYASSRGKPSVEFPLHFFRLGRILPIMNCIVTAGPTYEKLDNVRRLTNFS